MNVNLDDYDIYHKKTKGIRLRIPRDAFLSMVMALSHCIEKYTRGIEFIVLTSADADDELDELEQAKESAENLRKGIFDVLHPFLSEMESDRGWRHYGASYDDRYLTRIPDMDREILWACGSEKLLVDIIKFTLDCPITDWDSDDLCDWVYELKRGEHTF